MPRVVVMSNPPGLVRSPVLQSTAVVGLRFVLPDGKDRGVVWPQRGAVYLWLWPDGSLRIAGPVERLPSRTKSSVLSTVVQEVRYIHQGNGLAYRHEFDAGVTLERLNGGSPDARPNLFVLRLSRSDGLPLYQYFPNTEK